MTTPCTGPLTICRATHRPASPCSWPIRRPEGPQQDHSFQSRERMHNQTEKQVGKKLSNIQNSPRRTQPALYRPSLLSGPGRVSLSAVFIIPGCSMLGNFVFLVSGQRPFLTPWCPPRIPEHSRQKRAPGGHSLPHSRGPFPIYDMVPDDFQDHSLAHSQLTSPLPACGQGQLVLSFCASSSPS